MLKPPPGKDAPTDVMLPNGQPLRPDSRGRLTISLAFSVALIRAGWRIAED
jgi:hypothetical protein